MTRQRSFVSRALARVSAAAGVTVFAGAAVIACGSAFVSQAQVTSLRVFGVQVDTPYAKPGQTESLTMLYFDGSKRAFLPDDRPNPDHHLQILWIGGCHDPPGDLYYNCYPILGELFRNVDPAKLSPTSLPPEVAQNLGLGPTFSLKIPPDIITRRPPPPNGNVPYGVSFVFFAACGGKLGPPAPGAPTPFPLGCYDEITGAPLGADDFVVGYTPIYSYDTVTNANPIVEGGTFQGKASMNVACTADATCAPNEKCGKGGKCIPVVPHCTSQKVKDCPTLDIKPSVSRMSVEKDVAAPPVNGVVPEEVLWVAYYASDGVVTEELRLVNDATKGWNDDYGTAWSAPNAPAGEARIWAVVHDNRGGTAWWWQDLFID